MYYYYYIIFFTLKFKKYQFVFDIVLRFYIYILKKQRFKKKINCDFKNTD